MVYGPCLYNTVPRGWSPDDDYSVSCCVELSVHQNQGEIGLISEADRTQKYVIIVKDIFDVVRLIKWSDNKYYILAIQMFAILFVMVFADQNFQQSRGALVQ